MRDIEIPLKDNSSNVVITILDEPMEQKLIMLHSKYFSEQFGLNTTGITLELNINQELKKSLMILRMTSTRDDTHQSLYLEPEKFNELQLFFRKSGFPMNLSINMQEIESDDIQSTGTA